MPFFLRRGGFTLVPTMAILINWGLPLKSVIPRLATIVELWVKHRSVHDPESLQLLSHSLCILLFTLIIKGSVRRQSCWIQVGLGLRQLDLHSAQPEILPVNLILPLLLEEKLLSKDSVMFILGIQGLILLLMLQIKKILFTISKKLSWKLVGDHFNLSWYNLIEIATLILRERSPFLSNGSYVTAFTTSISRWYCLKFLMSFGFRPFEVLIFIGISSSCY